MPHAKQRNTGLGRCLIKKKNMQTGNKATRSEIHSINEESIGNEGVLESITEQTNLGHFMNRVAMSEQVFEARSVDMKMLTPEAAAGVLSVAEQANLGRLQQQHRKMLRIPRRPKWDEDTTTEELHAAEDLAFTNWRLELSKLMAVDELTVTPYEKNPFVWKQLWRVVERSDVLVQIVDARNPLLFRCMDLEAYVKEADQEKVNLLLVNKSDYLSEEQRNTWANYFREENIYAVFFSALESTLECDEQEGLLPKSLDAIDEDDEEEEEKKKKEEKEEKKKEEEKEDDDDDAGSIDEYHSIQDEDSASEASPAVVRKSRPSLVSSSKLYNREELIELLASICPDRKLLQTYVTIGLVGYPNVGKSSTINCLMREKKVTVSATPGKTKHFQTLYLSQDMVLCDCPGLVFPGFANTKQDMILWGVLSIDRIKRDYHSSMFLLCNLLPPASLEAAYSIPLPGGDTRLPTTEELLSAHAVTRGFMSARGRADTSRSARAILKDFMTGRLLHCVAPPTVEQDLYHCYTVQKKCKNRVKLTPQQQIFMPETAADVDAHLDEALGILKEDTGDQKPRKQRRAKKPKGLVELRETADGMEVVVTKPWKNRDRATRPGKKNPNTNNPYDKAMW